MNEIDEWEEYAFCHHGELDGIDNDELHSVILQTAIDIVRSFTWIGRTFTPAAFHEALECLSEAVSNCDSKSLKCLALKSIACELLNRYSYTPS